MKRSLLATCLLLLMTQTHALTLKVATLSPDGSAWMQVRQKLRRVRKKEWRLSFIRAAQWVMIKQY